MTSILILVYDAEEPRARRLVDWISRRDRDGRVVTFPFQNGQVVLMAPELAGLDFRGRIHTLDTATREIRGGPEILPGVLARLPGWAWAQAAFRAPWLARLAMAWFSR